MEDSINDNQKSPLLVPPGQTPIDAMDDVELAEFAGKLLETQRDYLTLQEMVFMQRQAERHVAEHKTYAFVGHSRAGKDFAAAWLGRNAPLVKTGYSLSYYLCRLGASGLGLTPAILWPIRHSYYRQLYRLGNALRHHDMTLLVRLALSESDLIVGPRSLREMTAARQQKLISELIWVERANVPPDPTLELTKADCDHALFNSGDADFEEALHRFFEGKVVFHNSPVKYFRSSQ